MTCQTAALQIDAVALQWDIQWALQSRPSKIHRIRTLIEDHRSSGDRTVADVVVVELRTVVVVAFVDGTTHMLLVHKIMSEMIILVATYVFH